MDKELILAYSENTEYRGELKEYQGMAEVIEPGCKDMMRMYMKTKRQLITEFKYTITESACPPLKACAARAAECSVGKPVMEAYLLTANDLSDFFGTLPMESFHCAQMAELTLKKMLKDYALRMSTVAEARI